MVYTSKQGASKYYSKHYFNHKVIFKQLKSIDMKMKTGSALRIHCRKNPEEMKARGQKYTDNCSPYPYVGLPKTVNTQCQENTTAIFSPWPKSGLLLPCLSAYLTITILQFP